MNISLKGLTKAQVAAIKAIVAPAPAPEPVVSAPVKADAAQIIRQFQAEHGMTVASGNPFGRVGCAYGACDTLFAPNGSGPWHHTSCPAGSVWFGKLQKAAKESDAAYQAMLALAKESAELLKA